MEFVSQLYPVNESAKCDSLQAAKRRKNAAHGASRGYRPENEQAPAARKRTEEKKEKRREEKL
jgi:hypothetical protein